MAVRKKKVVDTGSTQEDQEIIKNETVTNGNTANDITDINLSVTGKKRFRIDGDNNRIIYLNTSDFRILERFQTSEEKFTNILRQHFVDSDDDDDIIHSISETDKEMRDLVDYIFDSDVSHVCAPDGSMFDLFNGEFRFEHILNTLLSLYSSNMEAEIGRMKTKLARYTRKYTQKG